MTISSGEILGHQPEGSEPAKPVMKKSATKHGCKRPAAKKGKAAAQKLAKAKKEAEPAKAEKEAGLRKPKGHGFLPKALEWCVKLELARKLTYKPGQTWKNIAWSMLKSQLVISKPN
jgi:hypothetical protein